MTITATNLDQSGINTLRFLAADAVETAQSGHPGTAMGAAPAAYVLWTRFLQHSPTQPEWPNRDRFVLSCGHASMLLYGLLHLTGYALTLDDLKQFRRLGSITPGHPERLHTPGVETTTGPLGQGFANAVGMAIAEAHLAARFNKPDAPPIVDHFTYVLASDGDLMEGVTAEAASLAGHLRLGKLICLYDDNHVSIEGPTDLAFTEDQRARFRAYGWHVQTVETEGDLTAIEHAIKAAQAESERPSLIAIRSTIGHGAPTKQGKSTSHAGALGTDELAAAKAALGWHYEDLFVIPEEVQAAFRQAIDEGQQRVADWQRQFDRYAQAYPAEAAEFERRMRGELPTGWESDLPTFGTDLSVLPTRQANGPIINALAPTIPELLGGSADLAPATVTLIDDSPNFGPGHYDGRNLRFGVREHAMGSILNGLAAHGGLRPYGATFLVFYDYMRPAVRMAAMMKLPVIFVYTHDSVGLGEDGPTHQPIEQIAGLRSVPGLVTLRPCDANEAVQAWRIALQRQDGPTVILLTRQILPVLDRARFAPAEQIEKGAYILSEAEGGAPDLLLIATGSEVHVALDAQERLKQRGIQARVVAMPSWELFRAQPPPYRDEVLPPHIKARLAIEAGVTLGWDQWVGEQGAVLGLDRFGVSAPYADLWDHLGFTGENVARLALDLRGVSAPQPAQQEEN